MKTFNNLPAFLRKKADIVEDNLEKEEFARVNDFVTREGIEYFFSCMAESFLKD